MPGTNKRPTPLFGRAFWEELVVYGSLVGAYLFLVLKTLDRPLADLFHAHRTLYAFLALLLILFQGIALDLLTSFLVRVFRSRS
ncbi:MAG: hypothetical protein ACRD16_14430 [Thermoanaerobaculia bacterium]